MGSYAQTNPSSLNFGTFTSGGKTVTLYFTITNIGAVDISPQFGYATPAASFHVNTAVGHRYAPGETFITYTITAYIPSPITNDETITGSLPITIVKYDT